MKRSFFQHFNILIIMIKIFGNIIFHKFAVLDVVKRQAKSNKSTAHLTFPLLLSLNRRFELKGSHCCQSTWTKSKNCVETPSPHGFLFSLCCQQQLYSRDQNGVNCLSTFDAFSIVRGTLMALSHNTQCSLLPRSATHWRKILYCTILYCTVLYCLMTIVAHN